jgi:hypothetical protein
MAMVLILSMMPRRGCALAVSRVEVDATVAEDYRQRVLRSEDCSCEMKSTRGDTQLVTDQLGVSHTSAPVDVFEVGAKLLTTIRFARVRSARLISIRNTRC